MQNTPMPNTLSKVKQKKMQFRTRVDAKLRVAQKTPGGTTQKNIAIS